ncbi:MAG: alpha/beta hydrolase family esterase [Panacagrimonas sp.]
MIRKFLPCLIGAAALFGSGLLSGGLPLLSAANAATSGTFEFEVRADALKRNYRLYVPASYERNKPAPLVIALHGGLGTGKSMQKMSGLDREAERHGMLIAYPDGIGRGWNAGSCCGKPMENKVNDVDFMAKLIADVKGRYAVDGQRIFGTGFSNGAMLLHKVACERPKLFTAMAPASGGIMVKKCDAKSAPAMMLVQGRQDPRIPWDGGVFKGTYRPSIREIVASLGKRNRCDQSESVTRKDEGVICRALNGCGTRDVIWCELPGVGHQWAGGKTILPRLLGNNTDKFNASAEVMRFFAKH